jgi:probable phosphoglycerate mutase
MQPERATTLILVRHGETEWNLAGRIQGRLDSQLTPLGVEQGKRAAERLARLPIAAVYASDTGRARHTGELLATPHGLAVRVNEDLRERCYGDFEGLTLEELRQRDADAVARWLADRQRLAPPGGETQPDLSRRVMAALHSIAADHSGDAVAVAAHGGPIKSALFAILAIPIDSWDHTWVTNGSITILRAVGAQLKLAAYNDTCHLDFEISPTRGVEN